MGQCGAFVCVLICIGLALNLACCRPGASNIMESACGFCDASLSAHICVADLALAPLCTSADVPLEDAQPRGYP